MNQKAGAPTAPVWRNHKTKAQHLEAIAGTMDCRQFCSGCLEQWRDIDTEHVHLIVNTAELTPCDRADRYYCDICITDISHM